MRQAFPTGFMSLVRSGVVTHMVANPPSVDLAFAVAKAQDLPEVRFAAAFDDGTLLLGCPDGVPEPLKDIAQAIDAATLDAPREAPPVEAVPDADTLGTEIAKKLADLTDQSALQSRIEEIAAQLSGSADTDNRLANIEEGLARLAAAAETPPPAPNTKDDESGLADVRTAFEALQNNLLAALNPLARAADLTAMQTTQSDLLFAISAAAEKADGDRRERMMVQDTLDQLVIDLRSVQSKADQYGALEEIVRDVQSRVSDLQTRASPEMPATDALQDAITALSAKVDQTLDGIQPPHSPNGALEETLSKIMAQLDNLAVPQHPQQEPQMVRLEEMLAALGEKLASGAQPPAQTPTQSESALLIAQRQSTARFATALGTIVTRLEAVTDTLAAQQSGPQESDMTDALAQLNARFDGLDAALADLPAPQAGDTPDLTGVESALEHVKATLEEIAAAPAPDINLSVQRRTIAQFGTALTTAMARLERVADALDPQEETEVATDPTTEPAPVPSPTTPASLDIALSDLRVQFAELIAQQIQRNASKELG